jgi:hypothetical protein
MTKVLHLNYLRFKMIKVKRCQQPSKSSWIGNGNIFVMMGWIRMTLGSKFIILWFEIINYKLKANY